MFRSSAWNRLRYDAYAPVYDAVVRRVGFFHRARGRAMELLHLRPGERVLLVAAGTGLDLEHIPAGVEVVANDISPAMVERARARAEALRLRATVEVMDAGRLRYPDAAFDAVVLHLALAVVPDPVAAAREAARVLRPGGRVSIFDKFLPEGRTPSPLRRMASAVAGVLFSDLNRRLDPLLAAAGLVLTHRESAGLAGNFVVARAEHPPA